MQGLNDFQIYAFGWFKAPVAAQALGDVFARLANLS